MVVTTGCKQEQDEAAASICREEWSGEKKRKNQKQKQNRKGRLDYY